MKISSASKKVLASALSAAMVVAFAPTVAFGAESGKGAQVEGTTALEGTVASYQTINGSNKLVTVCYTADLSGTAVNAIQDAINDAAGKTITLYQDITGNIEIDEIASLNLNGHTITNDSETAKGTPTVSIAASKTLTVKGGTITAAQGKASEGYSNKAVAGADETAQLAVVDGTFNGDVEANITEIKAGTFEGKVKDVNGAVSVASDATANTSLLTVAAGTFNDGFEIAGTVTDESTTYDAVATLKNVTIKDATTKASKAGDVNYAQALTAAEDVVLNVTGTTVVEASASGVDSKATAIDADVVTVAQKAALTVSAATAGANGDYTDTPDAAGITGSLVVNEKAGAVSVSAAAADDEASAVAVGDLDGTADLKATVAGEYEGSNVDAYAIDSLTGTITGGTIIGKVGGTLTGLISGGSFTQEIKESYLSSTDLGIVDDSTYYTVYTKTAGGTESSTSALSDATAIASAFEDIVDDIANGTTPANLKLAEGKTIADLQAAIKAGKIDYVAKTKAYKEKTATDAEKANYAAIEALAKSKNSYVRDGSAFTLTVEITNGETDEAKKVVYGYITDMGKGARGIARTVTIDQSFGTYVYTIYKSETANWGETVAFANDGKAAAVELAEPKGNDPYDIDVTDCGMYAVYTLSAAAIDQDKPEEPAAPEKATQSIDVAKKSLTVKLGAKKTKTAKGKSINLDPSAETAVTAELVSGSSKITLDGYKVKLAKGAVKGKTYTAKVSLKAAASDAYLAAASTITVKFVIK